MKNILDKFNKKSIIVVGDVMLDKYIFGKVDRISPEAPVQIVSVKKEKYAPGGAANAASNIASMTGNAFLFGIVGNDIAKGILSEECTSAGMNINFETDSSRPTIQKIRVLGQNQQLLRIDYENGEYIDKNLSKSMIDKIKNIKADAILLSDYAKGTITKDFMEEIKKLGLPIIIDPKPKHKALYKGCFLVTPNKKEAEEMTGIDINDKEGAEKACKKISRELDCNVLITLGEKGMSLFEKGKQPKHIPTVAKEVYDVSGAGDTVIAVLSLAISSGASMEQAAILANHAAGIKVGKLGTTPVSKDELLGGLKDG